MKEEIPPFEGGYFSDLPDELVTYILEKSLINPSTHLNPLILPLIPSALYEPTGG